MPWRALLDSGMVPILSLEFFASTLLSPSPFLLSLYSSADQLRQSCVTWSSSGVHRNRGSFRSFFESTSNAPLQVLFQQVTFHAMGGDSDAGSRYRRAHPTLFLTGCVSYLSSRIPLLLERADLFFDSSVSDSSVRRRFRCVCAD